jgi:hypothetical protein
MCIKFINFKKREMGRKPCLIRGIFKNAILKYNTIAIPNVVNKKQVILYFFSPLTKKDNRNTPKGIKTAFSLERNANIENKIIKLRYTF